jgi:hypothetical protein
LLRTIFGKYYLPELHLTRPECSGTGKQIVFKHPPELFIVFVF